VNVCEFMELFVEFMEGASRGLLERSAPSRPQGATRGTGVGGVRRLETGAAHAAAHAAVGSWLPTSGVGRCAVVGGGLPRAHLTAVGRARPPTGLGGGYEA
jgi:hypothetical protein